MMNTRLVIDVQPMSAKPIKIAQPKCFPCLVKDCGKIFLNRSDLLRHNVSHLMQQPKEVGTNDRPAGSSIGFQPHSSLQKKLYPCSIADCQKVFQSFGHLKDHVAAIHCEQKESTNASTASSPSVAQSINNQRKHEEIDQRIQLALMENRLLREQVSQHERVALAFHQCIMLYHTRLLKQQH